MSNKNEQAYPTQELRGLDGGGIILPSYGLTKRELIAAMAMQGWCANSSVGWKQDGTMRNIANSSVLMADALLEALK